MISTKLLSEVLGEDYSPRLVEWMEVVDNDLRTYYDCGNYDSQGRPTGLGVEINIYHLAHKCKEWANGLGWYIVSGLRGTGGAFAEFGRYEYDEKYADSLGRTNTEPEAIFKACEWILENR